jgi:hypothetical protein
MGANHADFFATAPGGEDRTFAEVKDIEPAASYGDNFASQDGDAYEEGTGASRTMRTTDSPNKPVAHFELPGGSTVKFDAEKMYENWRSTKSDKLIPAWKSMPQIDQASWQTDHPEGRKLMAEGRRTAMKDPTAFDSDATQKALAERKRQSGLNAVSELFPTASKGKTFLTSGKLENMSDPEDHSDELDYHKAWFAHITSKPLRNPSNPDEVKAPLTPHADNSSFEGLHNLIHNTVQKFVGAPLDALPKESKVAQHARQGLAAVSRAAMHHTMGSTDKAHRELTSAAKHVQNMMSVIKGSQMNSGVGVSAAPAPEVSEAASHAAKYATSVSDSAPEVAAAQGSTGMGAAQRSQRIARRERL